MSGENQKLFFHGWVFFCTLSLQEKSNKFLLGIVSFQNILMLQLNLHFLWDQLTYMPTQFPIIFNYLVVLHEKCSDMLIVEEGRIISLLILRFQFSLARTCSN